MTCTQTHPGPSVPTDLLGTLSFGLRFGLALAARQIYQVEFADSEMLLTSGVWLTAFYGDNKNRMRSRGVLIHVGDTNTAIFVADIHHMLEIEEL